MKVGDKVTAEVLIMGKPEKISGAITNEYPEGGATWYEIRPEGFESLTIVAPDRNVYPTKPNAYPHSAYPIIQPEPQYIKKKR